MIKYIGLGIDPDNYTFVVLHYGDGNQDSQAITEERAKEENVNSFMCFDFTDLKVFKTDFTTWVIDSGIPAYDVEDVFMMVISDVMENLKECIDKKKSMIS
jgi:hypothetical protein